MDEKREAYRQLQLGAAHGAKLVQATSEAQDDTRPNGRLSLTAAVMGAAINLAFWRETAAAAGLESSQIAATISIGDERGVELKHDLDELSDTTDTGLVH